MADWVCDAVVRHVQEDLLLRGVHHGEVVGQVEVLWQSGSPEVKELCMGARHVDADVLVGYGLRHEHVVLRHHNAVATDEDFVHRLEEVVGLVQVDAFLPSLSGLLVTLEIRVVSDEDSGLRLLLAKLTEAVSNAGGLLGDAPSEIEDVALHELPGVSEVLRHIELLVDLARLVVVEVSARRPSSCQGPLPLVGMEMEFVNLLAGVECSQVGATVLSDPIDAVCTYSKFDLIN